MNVDDHDDLDSSSSKGSGRITPFSRINPAVCKKLGLKLCPSNEDVCLGSDGLAPVNDNDLEKNLHISNDSEDADTNRTMFAGMFGKPGYAGYTGARENYKMPPKQVKCVLPRLSPLFYSECG